MYVCMLHAREKFVRLAGGGHFRVSRSNMGALTNLVLLFRVILLLGTVSEFSARPVQLSTEDSDAIFAKIASLLNAHVLNSTLGGPGSIVPLPMTTTTTTTMPPLPQPRWEIDLENIRAEKVGAGLLHDPMVYVQVSQDPELMGYVKMSQFEELIRRNFEVCKLNKHFRMPGQKTMFSRSNVCSDGLDSLDSVKVENNVALNVTLSTKSVEFNYDTVRSFFTGLRIFYFYSIF